MKKICRIFIISFVILLVYLLCASPIRRILNRPRFLNVSYSSSEKMSVKETNKFRTHAVYNYCRKLDRIEEISKKTLSRIIVDDYNKILYCPVPKVASTSWSRILYILTRNSTEKNPLEINADMVHRTEAFVTLANFTKKEQDERMRRYKKFFFVRNPIDRLISAYRNKLDKKYAYTSYFRERFGKPITRKYRKNPPNASLSDGDDATFEEFFLYLADLKNFKGFNEHWQLQYDLCQPCSIHYDFIGHYENVQKESDYVLKNLIEENEMKFPEAKKKGCNDCTRRRMKEYMRQLPKNLVKSVIKVFARDFEIFGYSKSLRYYL